MPDSKDFVPGTSGQMHIVPLDRERHAGLGVDIARVKQYQQGLNTVYLNVIEFFYAMRSYPVAFVSDDSHGYLPCAVTGLDDRHNLFISEHGEWERGLYVPAQARMYPVYVSAEKPGDDRRVILVDEEALVESGDPYFNKQCEPTDKLKTTEKFVSDYISAEKLTRRFTEKIASLDLLEPFDAQVNPGRASPKRLTGLYRVNEDRLNKLPAKDIKVLMTAGEMSRIYAHLISLENFSGLLDRSVGASMQ